MTARRLTAVELGAIVDKRRAEALATLRNGCNGDCSQGRQPCDCRAPMPAESATELGAEPEELRELRARMGQFKPWERFLIVNAYPVALVSALVGLLVLWATKP